MIMMPGDACYVIERRWNPDMKVCDVCEGDGSIYNTSGEVFKCWQCGGSGTIPTDLTQHKYEPCVAIRTITSIHIYKDKTIYGLTGGTTWSRYTINRTSDVYFSLAEAELAASAGVYSK